MITKETAHKIACAHFEIEAAEKLLADILAAPDKPRDPREGNNYRGGYRYGIELGVRMDSGMRCFDVLPSLAAEILKAHIAAKRDEVGSLSVRAIEEVAGKAPGGKGDRR